MIIGGSDCDQMGEDTYVKSTPNRSFNCMSPHYKGSPVELKNMGYKQQSLRPPTQQSSSTSHLQPFTAPWLTEVARLTAVRQPKLFSPNVAATIRQPEFFPPNLSSFYHPYHTPVSMPAIPNPYPSHYNMNAHSFHNDYSQYSNHCRQQTREHSFGDMRTPLGISGISNLKAQMPEKIIHQRNLQEEESSFNSSKDLKEISLHSDLKLNPLLTSKGAYALHKVTKDTTSRSSASTIYQLSRKKDKIGSEHLKSLALTNEQIPSEMDTDPNRGMAPSMEEQRKSPLRPCSPFHPHFKSGSLVSVGFGVRKVDDLSTEDFVDAAQLSSELSLAPSTVVDMTPSLNDQTSEIKFILQIDNKEASVETFNSHPFYVFHKGWSSCDPVATLRKYSLSVRKLQVGDVCVSLRKISDQSSFYQRDKSTFKEIQSALKHDLSIMPPPKTPTSINRAFYSPGESAVGSTNSTTCFDPSKGSNLSLHADLSSADNSKIFRTANNSIPKKFSTPGPFLGVPRRNLVIPSPEKSRLERSISRCAERTNSSSLVRYRKRRWSDP